MTVTAARGAQVRRALTRVAALACTTALALAAVPAAVAVPAAAPGAESPSEPPSDGLFGEGDPTYDGVWRQSMALLAQDAVGYTPAVTAVDWLLEQQCGDGSYHSYREDPGARCDVTAADTNATALAVQALSAVGGHRQAVSSALRWLEGVQNADGGWSYNPGGATDANSTAVVVGAFAAAGEDPERVRQQGVTPFDALTELQLGCDAAEDERGAFASMADAESGTLFGNDLATVDAVLAAYGSGLVVAQETADANASVTAPGCDGETQQEQPEGSDEPEPEPDAAQGPAAEAGAAGAAYLRGVLESQDQRLLSVLEGQEDQPDYGTTARAVIALAAGGDGEAAAGPLEWLADNHTAWPGYAENPAALGVLVLAAQAGGATPEDFGGTDLVAALNELGPAPHQADAAGDEAASDDGGAGPVLWALGVFLVLGIALGTLLGLRRGRRRPA